MDLLFVLYYYCIPNIVSFCISIVQTYYKFTSHDRNVKYYGPLYAVADIRDRMSGKFLISVNVKCVKYVYCRRRMECYKKKR